MYGLLRFDSGSVYRRGHGHGHDHVVVRGSCQSSGLYSFRITVLVVVIFILMGMDGYGQAHGRSRGMSGSWS